MKREITINGVSGVVRVEEALATLGGVWILTGDKERRGLKATALLSTEQAKQMADALLTLTDSINADARGASRAAGTTTEHKEAPVTDQQHDTTSRGGQR